jgi:hypothetical protein
MFRSYQGKLLSRELPSLWFGLKPRIYYKAPKSFLAPTGPIQTIPGTYNLSKENPHCHRHILKNIIEGR